MASLSNRNQETSSGRKCVGEEATLWDPADRIGGFPGNVASWPMYISCAEEMTSDSGDSSGLAVYFGIKDNQAYIAEVQQGGQGPRMTVLASIGIDGDSVEVWQITVEDSDRSKASWVQIKATKSTKDLEMSIAGMAPGLGIGCGTRLRSKDNSVYFEGEYRDQGMPSSHVCNYVNNTAPICIDGVSLEETESLSDCDAIKSFSVSTMNYQGLAAGDFGTKANTLITDTQIPTTITDFNK